MEVADRLIEHEPLCCTYPVCMVRSVAPGRLQIARSIDRSIDPAQPDTLSSEELPDSDTVSGPRHTILLAGLALFSSRGYHATSIRDIAAQAGYGSASLYSYFTSKEEILAALVLLGHDVHHRGLISALADSQPDPGVQLHAVITAHVITHCRYPALALVATHERQHLSPTAAAPAAALRRQSEQLLTDVVLRGIDQGIFSVPAVEATLVAIGSMGIAVASWYPDRSDHLQPAEVASAYADLGLRMVGAPPVTQNL